MKLEVLLSTMHQSDYSLLDKMNIKSDVIVVNQCDENEISQFDYNGYNVKWMSLKERGIGLSRNTALMRSKGDILLFADDDVVYEDNYVDKVVSAFESNPKADIIVFNLSSLNPARPEYIVKKDHKVHWYNSLKYGAFRIAVRRESLLKHNLSFSLLFGGGARYQAGEDNLFITEALKKGMQVYSSSEQIGTVKQADSTWFKGYDEKYYKDRGALFAAMYRKKAKLLLLLMELKSLKSKNQCTLKERLIHEFRGEKSFKQSL